jgi:hypothetical protein
VWWRDLRGKNDWDRHNYLEIQGGNIKFVPSKMQRFWGVSGAQAPFPEGAKLEYQKETGDRYFTGDHGLYVAGALWIVAQGGARQKLFDLIGIFPRKMLLSLTQAGIPCRAVNIYNGQDGEHTEIDITAQFAESPGREDSRFLGVLLGTSSIWLGVITAILVRNSGYVIGIGVLGYIVFAAIQLRWSPTKRSAAVGLLATVPSFAGGYAIAVIAVWYLFK